MTDIIEADNETERLLAELEAQDKVESDEVEPDTVLDVPKKKSKVTSKQSKRKATDTNVIINIGKNPHRIKGVIVPVGDEYILTDRDLEDEILMKKIDHGIKLGVLSRGTG